MTLAERLVHGLRTPATEDGYRLDRAVIDHPADALLWIENWWSPSDGFALRRSMTDEDKQRAAEHWLFLRWRHRQQVAHRGGGR